MEELRQPRSDLKKMEKAINPITAQFIGIPFKSFFGCLVFSK
jgi:hypothetical protein